MTPEQILDIPPRVLTQAQREFYFSEGYILLERIIGDDWLKKLRAATEDGIFFVGDSDLPEELFRAGADLEA